MRATQDEGKGLGKGDAVCGMRVTRGFYCIKEEQREVFLVIYIGSEVV